MGVKSAVLLAIVDRLWTWGNIHMPMSARASSPTKSDSAADSATQIEPKRTVDILLMFVISVDSDPQRENPHKLLSQLATGAAA